MKITSTRSIPTKAVFLAVTVLLALSFSIFLISKGSHSNLDAAVERQQSHTRKYREQLEQKGVLSSSDSSRLVKISTYITSRQELSDDDLDFWITLLHKGPLKDTPSNYISFYINVMEDALGHKNLSPSGKTKMYDAILPYVSDSAYSKGIGSTDTGSNPLDPSTQSRLRIGNEKIALLLLTQTRDPRVMGELTNLSQTASSPEIRQLANSYYARLSAKAK